MSCYFRKLTVEHQVIKTFVLQAYNTKLLLIDSYHGSLQLQTLKLRTVTQNTTGTELCCIYVCKVD